MILVDAYRAGFGGQDLESARRVLQTLSSGAVDAAVEAFETGEYDSDCLCKLLEDESFLLSHTSGSLAREFLEWKRLRDLDISPASSMMVRGCPVPETVEASYLLPVIGAPEDDTKRHWVIRRWGAAHDLWHVITGFDVDPLGEALLAAWSSAATPKDWGNLLFAVVAGIMKPRMVPRLWRSYWWGRSFRGVLVTAPWERWLMLEPGQVLQELERLRSSS